MVYKWLKSTLYRVASKQCLLCLNPTQNKYLLCSGCAGDLPINKYRCVICSIPFSTTQASEKQLVCGKCQKNPPHYTTSLVPHLYETPIKQLITSLKFHSNLTYAPLLAQNFVNAIQHRKNNLPECIIPVPLHRQRLRERGFNQALEFSRIISSQINVPLDYTLCERKKTTPYQSGLSAKQRKQNLKNAFNVTKPHTYKHVAIFDDVVTTGTTVNELAKQLKQSGVETIEVWAIARTRFK